MTYQAPNSTPKTESASNMWRMLECVARRRRFIGLFVMVATPLAFIISFLMPSWYKAEALLMPPKDTRMVFSNDAGDLADIASLTGGLNLPVMVTASDVYVRLLESRTVADRVIDSLGLVARYESDTRADTRLALKELVSFRVTPEGLISVTAIDKNPDTAALISNLFVRELDRVNRELTSSRTAESRLFLENRLSEARKELDSARSGLQRFQTENRAVDLDRQTEMSIASAATLKAELATAEVDFTLRSRTLSPAHPEVVELASRVKEYRQKINDLEYGSGDSSYFSLPVASTPYLTSRLADLRTRVTVAEKLYENLIVRFEEARLQEKREAPGVAILDLAEAPELRFRPQRGLIVGVVFGFSLVLAVFLALFLDYLAGLAAQNPMDYARAAFFFETLLGKGLFRRTQMKNAGLAESAAQAESLSGKALLADGGSLGGDPEWPTDIRHGRLGR